MLKNLYLQKLTTLCDLWPRLISLPDWSDRDTCADKMRRDKTRFFKISANENRLRYQHYLFADIWSMFDRCFHSCVITRCSSIFNFRSLSRGTIYIEQANLSLFLSFSLRLCQPDLSFAGFSKFTVIHKVIFRLSNYRDMLLPSPKVNDISRSNVFLLLPARINVPRVL